MMPIYQLLNVHREGAVTFAMVFLKLLSRGKIKLAGPKLKERDHDHPGFQVYTYYIYSFSRQKDYMKKMIVKSLYFLHSTRYKRKKTRRE